MKILFLFALAVPLSFQANTERTVCKHGCESKYCRRVNCGDKCKMGPRCRGCWKR